MKKKPLQSHKKESHRWEVVLLFISVPVTYLVMCFVVLNTEYDYPHRYLINLFDSELMPCVVILAFDVGWLIFLCFSSYIGKRTRVYLSLAIYILSAVAITDIYFINVWRGMMM